MNTYIVYKPKDFSIDNVKYVKEGFSFRAFFFNILWLLYHKIWGGFVCFSLFIFFIVQLAQMDLIQYKVAIEVLLGSFFYLGYSSYDMLIKRLERDGYALTDVIIADSQEEAELKYLASL